MEQSPPTTHSASREISDSDIVQAPPKSPLSQVFFNIATLVACLSFLPIKFITMVLCTRKLSRRDKEEVIKVMANGVRMILNPLSAFRAMNKAAENVYTAIRRDGSQANVIDTMQTREELYQAINYYEYEKALDQTLGKDNG